MPQIDRSAGTCECLLNYQAVEGEEAGNSISRAFNEIQRMNRDRGRYAALRNDATPIKV